jgi:hypothetical protein
MLKSTLLQNEMVSGQSEGMARMIHVVGGGAGHPSSSLPSPMQTGQQQPAQPTMVMFERPEGAIEKINEEPFRLDSIVLSTDEVLMWFMIDRTVLHEELSLKLSLSVSA